MAARSKDLLARDTYLNLVRVHDRLTSQFAALFRSQGLTSPQYNVLRIVLGGPKAGVSCQHIADHLLTRVPDVTRLLDRMEAAGLVRRARSEEDRRVVRVRATPKGRRACEKLAEPVLDLHRRQFDGLTVQAVTTLNEGLEEVLRRT